MHINTIELKNILLKDVLLAFFGDSGDLFTKIGEYYKNNLEDIHDVKYYEDLIKKNLNNLVNVEITKDVDINFQYLVNFNYPTSDFLVFNSDNLKVFRELIQYLDWISILKEN